MNYYPFHIGDYASATRHLSWNEDAAYRRLIDAYYIKEGPLPAELRQVFRLVLAQTDEQREAVETVLNEFFELTPEGWRHSRCDKEIGRSNEKKAKASASATAKWQGVPPDAENRKKRSERLALARKKATHTEREWSGILAVCGFKCVSCGAEKGIVKDHIIPIYQGGSDGVENLQPLCRSCNSRKGPDSADLRPTDWRERLLDFCGTPAVGGVPPSSAVDDACGASAPNPNPNPNPKEEKQSTARKRAPIRPESVPDSVWQDFLAIRKAKRSPLTDTALDGIANEASKAGMSLAEALAMCCQRGWQGFNAGWVVQQPRASPVAATRQDRISATVAELTGRNHHPETVDVIATERTTGR